MPCTTTQITAASPQELSEQVSRALDGDATNAPTTWVPDSSLWRNVLARDPRLSSVLPRNYPVVAATPVVFAAPRPMAEALRLARDPALVGAAQCARREPRRLVGREAPRAGRVRLDWPDPLTSTAGLGSTVAVYRDLAIGAEATDDLRRRLVTAHNAVNGATGNLSGALAALRAKGANRRRGAARPADRARDRAGGRRLQRRQAGRRGGGDLPDRGLGGQRGAGAAAARFVGQ